MAEEKAKTHEEQISDLSKVAFSGPATYASRFVISITAGGVRIAFLDQETQDSPAVFCGAVMAPFEQAIGLQKLLANMLKDVEGQLDAAKKAAVIQAGTTGNV